MNAPLTTPFEPQTEIGKRIINNPEAPTYCEIRQVAFHMASLWEAVAGSAERFETVMLRYHALNIRDGTRQAFDLIKAVSPDKVFGETVS
jgi:hypothetical protein